MLHRFPKPRESFTLILWNALAIEKRLAQGPLGRAATVRSCLAYESSSWGTVSFYPDAKVVYGCRSNCYDVCKYLWPAR
jgi:hypothetical protein